MGRVTRILHGTAADRKVARDWLARALESFRQYRKTGNVRTYAQAVSEADEALEHAAKVGDHGRLVGSMQRRLDRAARGKR
jgi:hypothetical protein